MWSEVYSEDMFQTVFKDAGVLNKDAGRFLTLLPDPSSLPDPSPLPLSLTPLPDAGVLNKDAGRFPYLAS